MALEPVNPADMPELVAGLALLAQADPCVEAFQQQTGEHVILTAGELHLEVRVLLCLGSTAIWTPSEVSERFA